MPKTGVPIPVYIPWETFTDFVKGLKATKVPSRIDKSILTHLPALTRGQLLSALRFLKLIDQDKSTKSGSLAELAAAFGTSQWSAAVKEHVVSAYGGIIADLDLESATPHQLDECFDKVVSKEQMRQKSERFYLAALADAKVSFSLHLVKQRTPNGGVTTKQSPRKTKPKKTRGAATGTGEKTPSAEIPVSGVAPSGMIDFPIPMGEKSGFIRVRTDLTLEQYRLVEAMLNAVKVMAEMNDAKAR